MHLVQLISREYSIIRLQKCFLIADQLYDKAFGVDRLRPVVYILARIFPRACISVCSPANRPSAQLVNHVACTCRHESPTSPQHPSILTKSL